MIHWDTLLHGYTAQFEIAQREGPAQGRETDVFMGCGLCGS